MTISSKFIVIIIHSVAYLEQDALLAKQNCKWGAETLVRTKQDEKQWG